MRERPAQSLWYDWSMVVVSLWLSGGILLDAWWHFHSTVETFFEPAHALLYAGLLASYVFTAVAVQRNVSAGFPLRSALPTGYELTFAGLIVTLAGGLLDMLKHTLFGFEEGFNALVSPTHLIIGAGMFLIITGPIRATLSRERLPQTFTGQLPMMLALASMMELIHWGTQFLFLTGAETLDAPYPAARSPHDTLTLITLQYYKQGTGLAAILVQSLLVSAFAIFAARRIRFAAGALTAMLVVGNAFVAAAHANAPGQFWAVIAASAAAGAGGEYLLARRAFTTATRENAFAFAVPAIYAAVLLLVLAATMNGLWWSPDVISGSILFAGLAGLFVNSIAKRHPAKASG